MQHEREGERQSDLIMLHYVLVVMRGLFQKVRKVGCCIKYCLPKAVC